MFLFYASPTRFGPYRPYSVWEETTAGLNAM